VLEHVGRHDDVVRVAQAGQALLEVGLDEVVQPLGDPVVLDDVDPDHVVSLRAHERPELAVGAADVEDAPGRSAPEPVEQATV